MPVMPHSFRPSCIMYKLCKHQPAKVFQTLDGHKECTRDKRLHSGVCAGRGGNAFCLVQRGGCGSGRGAAIASAGLKAAGKEAAHPAP